MNFLSNLAGKLHNEFTNPESHMRKGLGKVSNEFTNPESDLRTLKVRSGISVKNESPIPVLVICSELTPLHWGKIEPGETWNSQNVLHMGKVWFTVSVSVYDEKNVPTVGAVVASILALTARFVLISGSAVFIAAATAAGIYSVRGVSMTGVYSDGKTLVVRGAMLGDGAYALTLQNIDDAAPLDPAIPEGAPAESSGAGAAIPEVAPAESSGAGAVPSV